jgi:prepilin peptidase CpaA
MLTSLGLHLADVSFLVVFIELIIAVYFDLTTAKFPNKFFISFLTLNLLLVIVLGGFSVLSVSLLTLGVAVLLMIPIYLIKMLGGGDVKLILAVSPMLLLDEFIGFLMMSFVWAGVFGFIRSAFGGNARALLVNTLFMTKKVTVATERIPFTVGILLGWCSYKSFMNLGFL